MPILFPGGGGGSGLDLQTQFDFDNTDVELSTTSVVPNDDTKPQISEGTNLGLSVTMTPSSATHRFKISFDGWFIPSTNNTIIVSLFDGNGTDALKTYGLAQTTAGYFLPLAFNYAYTPGDTTARTFTVRFGVTSGTGYFLRSTSANLYGGANVATLIAEEFKAAA